MNNFNARETVVVFFDGSCGRWAWNYTLEKIVKTKGGWGFEHLDRRQGVLDLQHPQAPVAALRRALMSDQRCGAFIPQTDSWFNPTDRPGSGWMFVQGQDLDRAARIRAKAEAA